ESPESAACPVQSSPFTMGPRQLASETTLRMTFARQTRSAQEDRKTYRAARVGTGPRLGALARALHSPLLAGALGLCAALGLLPGCSDNTSADPLATPL